ncbi:Vacuolar fusion protein [Neofusicoccum parvum]|uniref:Vacuolar fusion protein n=1 Tax=Neofusicoccum parvum TaxID=310453 RepID=A0ACB5SQZ3_9PEZI|nr:Vacuolar fusion protein [Neofusicoccum parvum]
MAVRVVPAQLASLAVFCPDLAADDDAFRDQLVFYHTSKPTRCHDEHSHDDENERLRQIGLAQGMINFARSFSDGAPVDHVDTEKSRIVMHELEKGWWILAIIDLTRLPAASSPSKDQPAVEYSAREVAPPELLLRQLLRAHSIFRLHHGLSLADLYVRVSRQKFCNTLDRFWSRFAKNWDVLLHGNPAADIYPAVKLAAGGELGMGVGEEEWGSGEREVFEDFTSRTEGMLDMVVSRFGEPHPALQKESKNIVPAEDEEPWMGAGRCPEAADGVIFSGIGAISRSSVRDISSWMQWLYTYGDHAYGVKENPSSDRRKRRRQRDRIADEQAQPDSDTWMKYLTWGYSSAWGGKRPKPEQRSSPQSNHEHLEEDLEKSRQASMQHIDPHPDVDPVEEAVKAQIRRENAGHFLIGLEGDLEEVIMSGGDAAGTDEEMASGGDWEYRTLLRTLHVELTGQQAQGTGEDSSEATISHAQPKYERLRVIIYVAFVCQHIAY